MKKILVVEDNKTNMKMLRIILQANGYEIIEAFNEYDGVQAAKNQLPDMILMDIQLPGINGIECFMRIRNAPETQLIPVIAITSYVMRGDEETLKKLGFTSYLAKPIGYTALLELLTMILGTQ